MMNENANDPTLETKSLTFETGVKTFTVNGTAKVSYNPTDSYFIETLFAVFDKLDARQNGYKARIESAKDSREIFEVAREQDLEMRELIDSVFSDGLCGKIFSGINVYAMADGLPIWANFMLAVIDTVDTTFAREQKATNPRIQKYTSKYHK